LNQFFRLGLAIVQEKIFPQYVLEQFEAIGDPNHQFIRGLSVLRVDEVSLLSKKT
jgi:hypothetical protein